MAEFRESIFVAAVLAFLKASVLSSLLFYLWSRPRWIEVLMTFLGGIALTWLLVVGRAPASMTTFLVGWGLCAFAVAAASATRGRAALLKQMFAPVLAQIIAAFGLILVSGLVSHTLDYYLYAFDGSLGFQPGFLGGQLLARVGWLRWLTAAAYVNLLPAICFVYLMHRDRSAKEAERFLRFQILLGLVGYAFYVIFPAVGTAVMFSGRFPADPPPISSVSVAQTWGPVEPRNCMPSLHTAWSMALLWACPRGRLLRVALRAYVPLVLLYALSCGHYLVDMIAALPFTLAVYAITLGNRRAAAASIAVFLLWLLLLRYATAVFLLARIIPWTIMAATLVFCYVLQRRIDPNSPGRARAILAAGTT
jgi:hypothetical protein